MKIVLCSAFRNACAYLPRYFAQVAVLGKALAARGDTLELILGEGDSSDNTRGNLSYIFRHLPATIVDCSHGGPVFGPVVNAQRFKQLAHVGNQIWQRIPATAQAVVYVESDLIWDTKTLLALIDRLFFYPSICPLILEANGLFYDVWAYRRGGQHFTKQPPYHPDINGAEVLQLDSAGSCLALGAGLARHVSFTEEEVFVGLCKQINQTGGGVYLDPALSIQHP
jgi:hypothetical protein